jgi:hypothetical protein
LIKEIQVSKVFCKPQTLSFDQNKLVKPDLILENNDDEKQLQLVELKITVEQRFEQTTV